MTETDRQRLYLDDPRLALHAAGRLPAWLWREDGQRVLWANAAAARTFGMDSIAALLAMSFDAADPRHDQVIHLAAALAGVDTPRLERLRGFGGTLGQYVTCTCARLIMADNQPAILIVAADPAGWPASFADRLQSVVSALQGPALALNEEQSVLAVNADARAILGPAPSANALGASQPIANGFRTGTANATTPSGRLSLRRVGAGRETALIALIDPAWTKQSSVPAIAQEGPPSETPEPPPSATEQTTPMDDQRPDDTSRNPLRFLWQMDPDARFSFGADGFSRLIGIHSATAFGRPWPELNDQFALDPDDRLMAAVATRAPFGGIVINWPTDEAETRLAVTLSGLPVFDRDRAFRGYRGFGVCTDFAALSHLTDIRSSEAVAVPPSPATPTDSDQEADVETPENVLPFRPNGEVRMPVLTPVENNAFNELARRLAERLHTEPATPEAPAANAPVETIASPPASPAAGHINEAIASEQPVAKDETAPSPAPAWLAAPEPAPRGVAHRDRQLLDLMPGGVLIYRLDRPIYANEAFLAHAGHPDVDALVAAGGLDALLVEPGTSDASSMSAGGAPVRLTAAANAASPASGRLVAIEWDGEPAHALILDPAAPAPAAVQPPPVPVDDPRLRQAERLAEDLSAILDHIGEAVVMFDPDGRIHACNRAAELLLGHRGQEISEYGFADMIAPDSRADVMRHIEGHRDGTADSGRAIETFAMSRDGTIVPVTLAIGRSSAGSDHLFAILRDHARDNAQQALQQQAERMAERAAQAKADTVAWISHQIRSPLNAIIGFAEVMIDERFGALGNDRYAEYMQDIRASGERVLAVINDLLDLSRVESGKLELTFANHNLNEITEHCVAMMQPQANRERIIIRSSLGHNLPQVVADGRILRQIVLNMLGTSIQLAKAGGQVIISTVTTDTGGVALRVRDTGPGLGEDELASVMEPLHNPTDQASLDNSGLNLSLTRALAEANKAAFHIKRAANSGTLIEVVFHI